MKLLAKNLLVLFIFSACYCHATAREADTDILNIYNQLKHVTYEDTRVLKIDSITIRKDRGNIVLKEGKIYFSRPIMAKSFHAVFIGDGLFTLNPPNEIEKFQMQRFLKSDSIYQKFSSAYFQFTDQTFESLLRDNTFSEEEIPGHVADITQKVHKLFLEERGINLPSHAFADSRNKTAGHFIAVFEIVERTSNFPNYLIFSYDATSNEAVGIHQFFPHRAIKDFYTVCSFPAIEATEIVDPVPSGSFNVTDYDMAIEVEKNGDITAMAEMEITSASDSLKVLYFDILDEMEIDSVKNGQNTLEFIKEEKESGFSVVLPQNIQQIPTKKITVFFSGEALEQTQNKYTLKNQLYWYPRKGYLRPAIYKLTFTYPEDMTIVATGEKLNEWEHDKTKRALWQETIPSIAAAFAFGRFESDSFAFFNQQKITVFSEKDRTKHTRESVARDVASSLYFFEKYLGQLPYDHVVVAENGSASSYGYRRTLLLTSLSFEHEIDGIVQALRGHETSHQWWGNIIGWKTYHDQWLSESLAEYSGALINQFLLRDDKYFWELVDGWRNDFLHHGHIGVSLGMRQFGFSRTDLTQSEGADAGPIWLGQRLGTKNAVDYYLNVYVKGALVIHMLRTMLHDFETNSDERFLQMLADFVQTYKGQKVTTGDFLNIVNKHFDQEMNWFFEQWIYGNKIPTYEYKTKITKMNAEFFIELQIEQKNVPPQFKAHIPIGIEFGKPHKNTHMILMDGYFKVFTFGPFPQKPRIVFNDAFGVLAYTKRK